MEESTWLCCPGLSGSSEMPATVKKQRSGGAKVDFISVAKQSCGDPALAQR
jgi:hypothetical protein